MIFFSKIIKKHFKVTISIALIFFIISSGYHYRDYLKPYLKNIIRASSILIFGSDNYVIQKIGENSSKNIPNLQSTQLIETASLPLIAKIKYINSDLEFPNGAGSIAKVGNSILIMDYVGKFYLYRDNKITSLNIPILPNMISNYIQHSSNLDTSSDAFRTYSIAYSTFDSKLYVSYLRYIDPNNNRFEISSINFNQHNYQAFGNWSLVFSSENIPSKFYGLAGGGKLLPYEDGIFFSIGDFGIYAVDSISHKHAAQDPSSSLGKIYKISKAGKVALISSGHRNTQGLVLSKSGQLLNIEQGPQGGDEINIIKFGKNYGWPLQTFGTDYGAYTWGYLDENTDNNFELPLFAFVPSVAADSIIQVTSFNKRWNGDFLVGSLKAQSLFRLKIIDQRVLFSEPIWIGHRIRELVEFDGKIILYTDDGLLISVEVDDNKLSLNRRSVDSVVSSSLSKCMACHHLGQTNPTQMAPTLSKIVGRPIGSDNFDKYSSGMKQVGGAWSKSLLSEFLHNPGKVVPGTSMPKIDLTEKEISDIVDQLSKGSY